MPRGVRFRPSRPARPLAHGWSRGLPIGYRPSPAAFRKTNGNHSVRLGVETIAVTSMPSPLLAGEALLKKSMESDQLWLSGENLSLHHAEVPDRIAIRHAKSKEQKEEVLKDLVPAMEMSGVTYLGYRPGEKTHQVGEKDIIAEIDVAKEEKAAYKLLRKNGVPELEARVQAKEYAESLDIDPATGEVVSRLNDADIIPGPKLPAQKRHLSAKTDGRTHKVDEKDIIAEIDIAKQENEAYQLLRKNGVPELEARAQAKEYAESLDIDPATGKVFSKLNDADIIPGPKLPSQKRHLSVKAGDRTHKVEEKDIIEEIDIAQASLQERAPSIEASGDLWTGSRNSRADNTMVGLNPLGTAQGSSPISIPPIPSSNRRQGDAVLVGANGNIRLPFSERFFYHAKEIAPGLVFHGYDNRFGMGKDYYVTNGSPSNKVTVTRNGVTKALSVGEKVSLESVDVVEVQSAGQKESSTFVYFGPELHERAVEHRRDNKSHAETPAPITSHEMPSRPDKMGEVIELKQREETTNPGFNRSHRQAARGLEPNVDSKSKPKPENPENSSGGKLHSPTFLSLAAVAHTVDPHHGWVAFVLGAGLWAGIATTMHFHNQRNSDRRRENNRKKIDDKVQEMSEPLARATAIGNGHSSGNGHGGRPIVSQEAFTNWIAGGKQFARDVVHSAENKRRRIPDEYIAFTDVMGSNGRPNGWAEATKNMEHWLRQNEQNKLILHKLFEWLNRDNPQSDTYGHNAIFLARLFAGAKNPHAIYDAVGKLHDFERTLPSNISLEGATFNVFFESHAGSRGELNSLKQLRYLAMKLPASEQIAIEVIPTSRKLNHSTPDTRVTVTSGDAVARYIVESKYASARSVQRAQDYGVHSQLADGFKGNTSEYTDGRGGSLPLFVQIGKGLSQLNRYPGTMEGDIIVLDVHISGQVAPKDINALRKFLHEYAPNSLVRLYTEDGLKTVGAKAKNYPENYLTIRSL